MADFFENCLSILRRAIQTNFNGKQSDAANEWGLTPGLLSQWLSGKRKPTLEKIGPILSSLNIRLNFDDELPLEYDLIPKVAAKAGAGSSLLTSGEQEGLYAFRRDFLARQGINARNAVLMDVMGDSMEPVLSDGDTILLNQADKEIREGKIYVVALGEDLRVKYLYKSLAGVILRSANKLYPDIAVSGPDLESLVIHGRVCWCGRLM